jgi:hypothetical protein
MFRVTPERVTLESQSMPPKRCRGKRLALCGPPYRISTVPNPRDAKPLLLLYFLAYPRIISTNTALSDGVRVRSDVCFGKADRLRVAVQLVDSAAGTLVWSAHFDRGLHDIFSIEDEIADQIAGALSVRLGELEPKPPAGARSANLEVAHCGGTALRKHQRRPCGRLRFQ